MTADVIKWDGYTIKDLPPDQVLNAAVGQLETAIVLGVDKNGEIYIASSIGSSSKTYMAIARAQKHLLDLTE